TLEVCERSAFSDREGFIIAKDGDRVVGYIAYGDPDEGPSGTGAIFGLYVLSEYHGTGVGRQLMDAALSQLKDRSQIFLWTLKENKRAIRFYDKCGFHPDGEETINPRIDAAEIKMVLKR
ncbi:MAG: GNAT family N-acetyltransferase, partial [Lachnospiraceae bacterium]|nr:GNAT family N-acetyltransferase [Lachnospiraceae bacterium]